MKTSTLQNKLKKMQLFFKKSLLFEKNIISLHSDKKSSVFCYILTLKLQHFQSIIRINIRCLHHADLFICNTVVEDLKAGNGTAILTREKKNRVINIKKIQRDETH